MHADTAAVLKVLGEPIRWAIVEQLANEELCVCHLVEVLHSTQPLVSHHLKVLREAGLVRSERYRQWIYYRLDPDALRGAAERLASVASSTPPAGTSRRPCC